MGHCGQRRKLWELVTESRAIQFPLIRIQTLTVRDSLYVLHRFYPFRRTVWLNLNPASDAFPVPSFSCVMESLDMVEDIRSRLSPVRYWRRYIRSRLSKPKKRSAAALSSQLPAALSCKSGCSPQECRYSSLVNRQPRSQCRTTVVFASRCHSAMSTVCNPASL